MPFVSETVIVAGFSGSLVPTGENRRCKSPNGIYDMVGNAGEWVSEGRVVGGDATTSRSDAHCDAVAEVGADYRDRYVGFRYCYTR